MPQDTIIVWFRNDLRLHDNVTLHTACQKAKQVIPVFIFDPRQFATTDLGYPKTGIHRANFLLESVQNLKESFQRTGSQLVIRNGLPEEILPELAQQVGANAIYASKEITSEETILERRIENRLIKLGIGLELFWQSTLYHLEDLPFPLGNLPDIFTQFRKKVEKLSDIRKTIPSPTLLAPNTVDSEEVPTLKALGYTEKLIKSSDGVLHFEGGEDAGKERLHHYFWKTDSLKSYKETRNGLLGADYSSKFSPWLALGCLSPRYILDEVERYEEERVANDSTYWLIFELIWRDYFKFVAKKYGNSIFHIQGTKQVGMKYREDLRAFERWVNGETGVPFIDANMKELKHTGFMSNRGRQNVASFLVKDLNLNWTWGASYFESALIDYDVCSNWCNWNYVAGVGNDPRENRYFNILSQAKRYDPKGEFIRHWLSDLKEVPNQMIHTAGDLKPKERSSYKMNGFPTAMVSASKWSR